MKVKRYSIFILLAAFMLLPEGAALAEAKREEIPYGTAIIDGVKDKVYDRSPKMLTDIYIGANEHGSTAEAYVVWNDYGLSIYADITEQTPDSSASTLSDRDSFEVFLDENHSKSDTLDSDDVQYRVGYDGRKSKGMSGVSVDMFMSAVEITETGYSVEMFIPFKGAAPVPGTVMGFEMQVNDGENAERISIAKWSDETGDSWQKTSNYGEIVLVMGEPADEFNILVALDGKRLLFENAEPVYKDGRVLVPMRTIFEGIGAEIAWYDSIKTVYAVGNGRLISLKIGDTSAYVNENEITLDVPAQIVNDVTLVPVRFVAESLGAKVEWNGEKALVTITRQQ